jgi:hypothetical protein
MSTTETIWILIDLGDAVENTRQVSPTPPDHKDSIYGFGEWPDPP